MKIYTTSRDDYLKAILVLKEKLGNVRSIDVAQYLGFSKASVSNAISTLSEGGYVYMDEDYLLHLTKHGEEIAKKIYERHCFFEQYLVSIGVDKKTAGEDACRLEHAISDTSFEKLKEHLEQRA